MKIFSFSQLRRLLSVLCCLLVLTGAAHARTNGVNTSDLPLLSNAQQQLIAEKNRKSILDIKLQALRRNKSESNVPIGTTDLRRADLAIAIAQADLENISLTLTAAQQAVTLTQNNIQSLQNLTQDVTTLATASNQQQATWQAQIKDQQSLLDLQQERVKTLQETQDLAVQAVTEEQDHKAKLAAAYQLQQAQSRQQALDRLAASMQAEQQKWLTRLATLNEKLQQTRKAGVVDGVVYTNLETSVFEAEERTNLNEIELNLARLQDRLADVALTPKVELSLSGLDNLQHQIDSLTEQLGDVNKMLQDKISLLQKRIKLVTQAVQNNILSQKDAQTSLGLLNALQVDYQDQLQVASALEDKATEYQAQLKQRLSKQLSARHGLPNFEGQGWIRLGERLLQIPSAAAHTFASLPKPIIDAIAQGSTAIYLMWLLFIIAWVIITIKLRSYLDSVISHFKKNSQDLLVTNSFLVCLKLLRRHLPILMAVIGFMELLILMDIPIALYSLPIYLVLVVVIFSMVSGLARLALLESTTTEEGSDVRLYRRLKWVLGVGCFLTILTLLVNQLPVAYDVQDLFGRVFMLFLLVVALVLLWGHDVVPALLEPYLAHKQPYLRQIVRLLSILVPLSILFNSLIGLVGYVELAWNIAAYQGIFLIVLTIYLLARGILAEIMKYFSEQVIRLSRNGWLWSEALLKPIHQILKIFLLLEAIVLLFNLYGWGSHSYVVSKITDILNMHLFVLVGTVITPFTFLMLFVLIAILVWSARWSREFAYRWLFVNTKDIGLRNSLSIFTQYITVIIGILISLRILGINITALTVIASAFAFGVGLGLRDLANNFVSGILLLLERPIKVGDYVTVSGTDGEVKHIGARSITVITDDHHEMLVPNSDVFTKTFVNWTHNSYIVRRFFILRINRNDDPHLVKELILNTLKTFQQIEKSPPSVVYMLKMEEMLLRFNVEYYIDMRKVPSRDTLQSKILFRLWDEFKAAGIHPPDVPQEIVVQGLLENKRDR